MSNITKVMIVSSLVFFSLLCKENNEDTSFATEHDDSRDIKIHSITTDSTLENNRYKYGPHNLFPEISNGSWCENEINEGTDVILNIELSGTSKISEFFIKNGYYNPKYWGDNNRVKTLFFEANGHNETVQLKDSMEIQKISLSESIETSWIKLTIIDVYKGTKYNDTCLNAISFDNNDFNKPQVTIKVEPEHIVKSWGESIANAPRIFRNCRGSDNGAMPMTVTFSSSNEVSIYSSSSEFKGKFEIKSNELIIYNSEINFQNEGSNITAPEKAADRTWEILYLDDKNFCWIDKQEKNPIACRCAS